MKYIKLFEDKYQTQLPDDEIKFKYKIDDYVLLSSKENWTVYNVAKIIGKGSWGNNFSADNKPDYYIETFHLETNKKYNFWIDENQIKRKSNNKEIEKFEILKNINKYNL